ncbi:lipoxygenase [Geopyxis carbonaria]|nr:lipoxygenase [Geopyxis carbonaria]
MHPRLLLALGLTLLSLASAAPQSAPPGPTPPTGPGPVLPPLPAPPADLHLPSTDPSPALRAASLAASRAGYLYGASLIGNTSLTLSGPLGLARTQAQIAEWTSEQRLLAAVAPAEAASALAALTAAGGLAAPGGAHALYTGQWATTNPDGVAPGVLDNATSDAGFAAQRLAGNAFVLRRLRPRDSVPFTIHDKHARRITGGDTVRALQRSGRLFVASHAYAATPRFRSHLIPGRDLAACTALFYQHHSTHQLLPLAIRTGVGANLTYTPLDAAADWTLAKTAYNANDLFHGQVYHLAASHAMAEIVATAALRSLAPSHPVLAVLDRVLHRAFAIRPVGARILFNPGGRWDGVFAVNSFAAAEHVTAVYATEAAGSFAQGMLHADFAARGLVDAPLGPRLRVSPFYDDAVRLQSIIRSWVSAWVRHWYASDRAVASDPELAAWCSEANGPAGVRDFPRAFRTRAALVDALTHVAYLTGVQHHALNQGAPFAVSGVLGLHPAALWAPMPVAKGVASVAPWLPRPQMAVAQVALLALFNRPPESIRNETLREMFSDPRLEGVVGAEGFRREMGRVDGEVEGRGFGRGEKGEKGEKGTWRGLPFVYRALAPSRIPFFLSV